MKRELLACVIQKFNGYEFLRNHLHSTVRKDFIPIDVVYKLILNKNKAIECFFAPKIHLAFRTTVEKSRKGGTVFNHTHVRQCHYCNNYFVKSNEKMKKHLSCCTGKAGFIFFFDNGQIVDYQDHYRNLGDLPFSIYYDFEGELLYGCSFSSRLKDSKTGYIQKLRPKSKCTYFTFSLSSFEI